MLDNMLVAHGRMPFAGERRVVVAMAEAYSIGGRASVGALQRHRAGLPPQ
jgi:hypothetical protein